MKNFIKMLSSNFRAYTKNNPKDTKDFSSDNFPVWGNEYRYKIAKTYLKKVFDFDLQWKGDI